MHEHANSDLNIIKDVFPKLYHLAKVQSEKYPGMIPFHLSANLSECIHWASSDQGVDFWETLHKTRWVRNVDSYDASPFIETFKHTVPGVDKLFSSGPIVYTNKYNLSYDVNTGIPVDSDAFGVDFTTKRRICDY